MPNHVRKTIRDAIATALTGLTTSGANVFASRVYELQDADLPGLRIYTNDETVDVLHDQADAERTIELVIECCAKKASGFDDQIDDMVKEVETAIGAAQTAGGARHIDLTGIEIEMEGEAEKPVGVARVKFNVCYFTALGAPTTAL
jgi:hypothetical protein